MKEGKEARRDEGRKGWREIRNEEEYRKRGGREGETGGSKEEERKEGRRDGKVELTK